MPARAGDFRRSGSFEISGSPVVLEQVLQQLCWKYGHDNVKATLDGLPDPFGMPPKGEPEDAVHERRGRASATPKKGSRHSAGGRQGWRTREALKAYREQHPEATHQQALAAVHEMQEQQGERPLKKTQTQSGKSKRGWNTKVRKVIAEEKAKGNRISKSEASKIVSRRMRAGRTQNPAERAQDEAA